MSTTMFLTYLECSNFRRVLDLLGMDSFLDQTFKLSKNSLKFWKHGYHQVLSPPQLPQTVHMKKISTHKNNIWL